MVNGYVCLLIASFSRCGYEREGDEGGSCRRDLRGECISNRPPTKTTVKVYVFLSFHGRTLYERGSLCGILN